MKSLLQPLVAALVVVSGFTYITAPATAQGTAAPASSMVNDTDSGVSYAGGSWFYSSRRSVGDYQDDVHAARANGDSLSYAFTGTGVDYLNETCADEGSVDVYLDGSLAQTVSAYSAARHPQVALFSAHGLAAGPHTIKLVKRSGSFLCLDALRIYSAPGPQTVNDTDSGVSYAGGSWFYSSRRSVGDYQDDVHAARANGDSLSYAFTGTGVDYLNETCADEGSVDVYLDGSLAQTVSAYSAARHPQVALFSAHGLAAGPHTIKLVKRSGSFLCLDAFRIYPASAAAAPAASPAASPVASPVAPVIPTMAGFTAPTNLSVAGMWNGVSSDALAWDAVPGASSYNVYQYDQLIARGVTGTSFAVPAAQFNGAMTYTVTAVDSDCSCESLPSAIAMAMGAQNPSQQPSWVPGAPVVPTNPVATPDWNGGAPRITVSWTGDSANYTYNVYRDGALAVSNLWRLYYVDNRVRPGETHTYTITGANVPWTTPVESAPSASVTATALTAAPAPYNGKVQITGVVPDDDSVVVSFAAVPGAADYRIYDAAKPGAVKYSGGGLSIQMNGLNPSQTTNLVVQAVDKLGPFQKMDGVAGPGAMQMDGTIAEATNGQGDPSNVPNVLAASDPFPVTCQSQALTGDQAFFDDFTGDTALAPAALRPELAALSASGGGYYNINEVQNNNWNIFTYNADTQMSSAFIMNNHFMDTLYDGPTAANHPFSHNNNASMVMMPKATADISGGKTLHVTFEVDAHFDSRRWCDVFVTPAGEPLTSSTPTKLEAGQTLNPSGNDFVWQINQGLDYLETWNAGVQTEVESWSGWNDQQGTGRSLSDPYAFNGTMQDLDKRHKFDLYLSQNRYRVLEDGIVVRDVDLTQVVPQAGGPTTDSHLQWWTGRVQVYFVHELYHTGNDRNELVQWGGPGSAYWYNNRPWADERHWNDMGFEVLSGFPQ